MKGWRIEFFWYERPERGWTPFCMSEVNRDLVIELASEIDRQRGSGRYRYRVRRGR